MLSAHCYHFSIKFKPLEEFQHTRGKDQKFLHPDSPLHFLTMAASNKKADGPQVQAIRMNHEWNSTNLFHIIHHLLHCKKCHNLCDNQPGFPLTACDSLDEKSYNYSCSTVHHPKTVAVIAVGPAELAPCAAVYPLRGYLPAGNRLLCFSMPNFPSQFTLFCFHMTRNIWPLSMCATRCAFHIFTLSFDLWEFTPYAVIQSTSFIARQRWW